MTSGKRPIQECSDFSLGVSVRWPSPEDPPHGRSSGYGHLQSQEEEWWSLCTDCEPGLYLSSQGIPKLLVKIWLLILYWLFYLFVDLDLQLTKVGGKSEKWNPEELFLCCHCAAAGDFPKCKAGAAVKGDGLDPRLPHPFTLPCSSASFHTLH